MNAAAAHDEPTVEAPPPLWPMYRAVVGLGTGCALLIVTVYQLTAPIIVANRAEATRAAVFEVIPGAVASTPFVWDGDAFVPEGEGVERVHAGYDATGRLVGVAVEASGVGYQDVVRLLYGYAPAVDGIVGVEILESKETPGLGDKVSKDPAFLANFERLDVSLDAAGGIAHPIESVKHGQKTQPWQVDAITGATVTSFAVGDILRESSLEWVPRMKARVEQLEGGGQMGGGVP